MADLSRQIPPADRPAESFSMMASNRLTAWLAGNQVSLAITTYQTGKLFLVSAGADGELAGYERTFERSMGIAGDGQTMFLATAFQLWRLENSLAPGQTLEGCDRDYVPQVGYTTGDLAIHDVALDASNQPVFVSTRFSCLATISDRYHFEPLWMPSFVTKLAGEDRCHLNGLAMVDGTPRYVTACAATDIVDGWREHRASGGIVIDVPSGETIATGLSMPHSPRWHKDRLWLLDSGRGAFGFLDIATGRFEQVTFCPGFVRGLTFVDNYAIVGLSLPRHEATFAGLPLEDLLRKANVTARCGLLVIDITSGDIVHWLRLAEPVRELYDVMALPGVRQPRLVGFQSDEIRTRVWANPDAVNRLQNSLHNLET